jgi:hypothetical protein
MGDFKIFAEYCVNYFKRYSRYKADNISYEVDNIFLDGVEYRLFVQNNTEFRHFTIKLRPTFTDRSEYILDNSDQYICYQDYSDLDYVDEDTLNSRVFMDLFNELKESLRITHFALYCEMERQNFVIVRGYDKEEYKAKLNFLKALEQEGVCYVCQEATLNTEHPFGCRHPIHLSCLYQMSRRYPKYVCGICKKTTEWDCMFQTVME